MQTSYSNHLCAVESGSREMTGDWITQGESLGCREWEVVARSWKPHAACVIVVHSQLFPCFSFLTSSPRSVKHLQVLTFWPQSSAADTLIFWCDFILADRFDLQTAGWLEIALSFFFFWLSFRILMLQLRTVNFEGVASFLLVCMSKFHNVADLFWFFRSCFYPIFKVQIQS